MSLWHDVTKCTQARAAKNQTETSATSKDPSATLKDEGTDVEIKHAQLQPGTKS